MTPSVPLNMAEMHDQDLKRQQYKHNKQKRFETEQSNQQSEDQMINLFMFNIIPSLRGGGCSAIKNPQEKVSKLNNQLPIHFARKIKDHTNIISENSSIFSDKINQDEILSSFQWFYNHKEYFQILCNDDQLNSVYYHLIETCAEILLKYMIIYIRLSGFLFYQLLDICNDLFRVIFSYQLKNEDRYMQESLKQSLLEIIAEIESQISIESINIWKNGVEFELQLIKTCIAHCRTNSEKDKELVIAIACGVASSISQLSPSPELIDALIEAGKYLLLNFQDKQIQHPLQKYEIYYFFEKLKWSIINQLKLGYSVQQTINTVLDGFNLYIKPSKDWMIHFCWVKFISDLMSYRPIVNKFSLLQAQNSNQLNWNELIVSNQVIQLPYDKASGKLQIFGKKNNLHLKQFHQLILFQEYLLDIQEKFQLLPFYSMFSFKISNIELVSNQDINIKKLISESNLEIIVILNDNLKTSKDQLISLFDTIIQQFTPNFSKIQSSLNSQISKDDIKYTIKQIKLYSQSFVYNLYELNIMINQERQAIEIIQNTLMQNKQFFKEKNLASQISIIQIIIELEQQYQQEYITNQKKFALFLIQILHKLSIYLDEVNSTNLLPDTSNIRIQECQFDQKQLQVVLINFINFVDKYTIQQKSIKRKLKKIFESKEVKLFLQERISQRHQSQILINIYNFNFIQQLGGEFVEYYNKYFIHQKELSQIDLRQNRIVCKQIIMILKLIKRLLALQQSKIISLNTSKDAQNSKDVQIQNQIKDQQNIKAILEKIILDRRTILQKLYDQFGVKIETDNLQVDFNEILVSIDDGIDLIQKQNWSEVFKNKYIMIFNEIKNSLQILELLENNQQSFIMEIIQLFNKQLEEINQEDLQQQQLIQIEMLSLTNNNVQQLKKQYNIQDCITSENLFNWDASICQIQSLIQNFNKISKIYSQRNEIISPTQVSFQKPILELVKDKFNQNYFEIYSNLRIKLINFLSKIAELRQIVFNENFLASLSEEGCLDQKTTIQIISEGSSFLYQKSNNANKEFIIDKAYTFMLQNLNIENNYQGDNFFTESSYKVREATVFNLIKMQSLLHEPIIQEFCQSLLKQIWTIEKHASVRGILKNKEMIEMQKKLFSQDLATFSNKLKIEMQKRLNSIEQLETQVLISDNQTLMKSQLQQAYEEFENYLDNVTDMSQRMDISLIFLREISKDLKTIKSQVDQILSSVKGIEDDVRRLSGKNYIELLQIRKEKILKQKYEAELDQVHIQIATQEYDPITGKKKESISGEFTSYLLKSKYNNFQGEINEFLWCESESQKDVMLLKGKAGSGKSRASRNIEEFVWLNDTVFPQWIPIYVSLPSLKDPMHNLLEQALESQNYNFDKIQIREFKEAVFNGNLKVIFILESYDEMKLECIQSNLYQTNRLAQDLNLQISGQNVKFIITTREEILTSIGYQTWFYGKSIETLKEVEILPFTQEQSSEYIRQYCEVSVKRAIKRFYEFFKQLRGQTISINEFKLIWSPLEENISTIINQKQNQDFLFSHQNVDQIIIKLQAIEFFNHIRTDQMISLKKALLKLWCQQKFTTVIKNVNINHFMSTPFMMELIVYVLPKMSLVFSESNYLRDTLKKQYLNLKKEASLQCQLRNYYKSYQQSENQLETLDIIELSQQQVESQNFLEQFQALENELDNQNFFENFSMDHSIEFQGVNKIITRQVFNVTKDANFIVGAFKLNQFTAYDFYETFVSFYHIQQLQNQKDLGKTFNYETTLNDLQDFSLYLALDMTTNQLTQVNYKQKGKLQLAESFKQGQDQNSWEDYYFDENQSNSEYCNFLKKCILLSSKGSIYTFNHKSIQEFFVAKYILNLLLTIFQEQDESIVRRNFYNSRFNANQFNLSKDHYSGSIELLKPKLNSIFNIKNKLLQITQLSKQHNQQELIRTASNTIYLLSTLEENLSKIDLSNVILSDTKLNNLTFFNSNLNNTKFKNVSIESCNFNCATIENSQWENIICKEKQTLIGHKKLITSLFFSKDGKELISGSEDGTVQIWKVQGDEKIKTFQFPNDQKVISASYSEEQNVLACLTTQSIQILRLDDPLVLEQLVPLQNYKYFKIIISHDGQYIAAQNNNSVNFIWKREALHINPNSQNYQLKFSSTISCTQVSHNAKLLAIGGSDILILSIRGFKDYQEITKLPFKTYSLTFSNDDQVLAAGIDQGKINFWSLKKINNIELLISITVKGTINKLLYSYDNKQLLCRTYHQIYLYETTKEQYALENSEKIIFSENKNAYFDLVKSSNYIAICATYGILIKQLDNNQTIQTLEEQQICHSVLYNKFDDLLIIGLNNKLTIYNISNIEKSNQIKEISLPFQTPLQMIQFNNSKQIIIRNEEYVSLHTLDDVNSYKMFQLKNPQQNFILINFEYFIIGIDNLVYFYSVQSDFVDVYFYKNYDQIQICYFGFSPDSKTFTIIDKQYQTKFNISTKEIITKQQLNVKKIFQMAVNKQQTQAIFLSYAQSDQPKQVVSLYDLKTNQLIQSLEELENFSLYCSQIAFSADSMNFVTGYQDNTIKLWDTKTYKLISMFQTNSSSINVLTLLNKNLLASVNQEYIRLWNLKALQQQQIEMIGHSERIESLQISSDGLQLISHSQYQIMRWDLQYQKSIDVLMNQKERINMIKYSDDAHYCAAIVQDGQIVVWGFNTKYLVERNFRIPCYKCEKIQFDVQTNQLISQHLDGYTPTNLIWDLEIAFQYSKYQNQAKIKDSQEVILMSPDQKFYISKSPLKIVSLLQEKVQQVVENLNINIISGIGAIAISKDSSKVALEDLKLTIILWSMQAKQQLAIFKDDTSSNFKILTMVFSGDGKILFSCHEDGEIRLWDTYDTYTLLQKYISQSSCKDSDYRSLIITHALSHKNDDFLVLWVEQVACYTEVSQVQFYFYHKAQSKIQLKLYSPSYQAYTPAYFDDKQLLAVQYRDSLIVYDLIKNQSLLILEGNQLTSSTQSSILSFSENGILYGIGSDQKLRCWNFQGSVQVILKQQVSIKAFQANENTKVIKVISEDNQVYEYLFQEFTDICFFGSNTIKFSKVKAQKITLFEQELYYTGRRLDLINKETKVQQIINRFPIDISCVTLSKCGKQFIVGLYDGSIYIYDAGKRILEEFGKPVCSKTFARSPILLADCCSIKKSKFITQENENLEKLLEQKGAKKL